MWSYPMIVAYCASLINHCLPAGRGDSWAEIIPKEDWSKEQIKKKQEIKEPARWAGRHTEKKYNQVFRDRMVTKL